MSTPNLDVPAAAELVESLLTVTHAIRTEHNSRLARLDASVPRGRLLKAMKELGRPRMNELAAHLGLNARTITTSVDALEREGILRRRPHPTDRRATLVELTERGHGHIEEWEDFQRNLAEEAMSPLGPEDRRELKRILEAIRSRGLGGMAAIPAPPSVGPASRAAARSADGGAAGTGRRL